MRCTRRWGCARRDGREGYVGAHVGRHQCRVDLGDERRHDYILQQQPNRPSVPLENPLSTHRVSLATVPLCTEPDPLLAGTLCEWDSRCWRALSASGIPAAGGHSLRVGFWWVVTCG
jgi:hypothetical protein